VVIIPPACEVLGNHRRQFEQSRLRVGAACQPWIHRGEPIFVADAHRGDGKSFVVRADEKLIAFLELEAAIPGGEITSPHVVGCAFDARTAQDSGADSSTGSAH
jgi:hypothetical protein